MNNSIVNAVFDLAHLVEILIVQLLLLVWTQVVLHGHLVARRNILEILKDIRCSYLAETYEVADQFFLE
jgi:hypothetical protein